MRCSFPPSLGTKPSGEHRNGGLPSTGTTRPSFRSSKSIAVIFGASKRAVERFFEIW